MRGLPLVLLMICLALGLLTLNLRKLLLKLVYHNQKLAYALQGALSLL